MGNEYSVDAIKECASDLYRYGRNFLRNLFSPEQGRHTTGALKAGKSKDPLNHKRFNEYLTAGLTGDRKNIPYVDNSNVSCFNNNPSA